MNGRREELRVRRFGDPWYVAGSALAVLATAALVLAEDFRWLRLGIIAALWAALVGAFLASKYRRQVESTQDAVDRAQTVYELELEREVAARREYELHAEAEIRRKVEAESRDQLAALRAEVNALRDSLQQLFGGEVLYERVALTAQSTRMRPLQEDGKYLAPAAGQPQLEGAPAQVRKAPPRTVDAADPRTELIARVLETDAPVRLQPRREPPRPPHREQPRRTPADARPPETRPPTADLPKRSTSGAALFSAEPFSAGPAAPVPAASARDWLAPAVKATGGSGRKDLSAAFPPRLSAENARGEGAARWSTGADGDDVQQELRRIRSENRESGRRRKPEEPPAAEPSRAVASGGHRRREEDAPAGLFESVNAPSSGRRAASPASAGVPAAELLSALGSSDRPRRRRRRDDD